MADEETSAITPPSSNTISDQDSTMEAPANESLESTTTKKPSSQATFSIWPPSQRTRDAVVHRLIETLSTPSVLSNRYGTTPPEESSYTARIIKRRPFHPPLAPLLPPRMMAFRFSRFTPRRSVSECLMSSKLGLPPPPPLLMVLHSRAGVPLIRMLRITRHLLDLSISSDSELLFYNPMLLGSSSYKF
ncbi:WPP domain-containing protein 1-like [Cannabis sativa]|uniref:WPP domain-containing protein 1-like n=1 Tax=Cannabis sativa TaxID=3483 RepID=UPI0029C9FB88|nr:WPP domain-containing protein 1-like [Cannabis sativa]